MNSYGLSALEIKAVIQRVLLPDICTCTDTDKGVFSLTLTCAKDSSCQIRMPGIRADSLQSSRAIAELVGEARYLLALRIQADTSNVTNIHSAREINRHHRRS